MFTMLQRSEPIISPDLFPYGSLRIAKSRRSCDTASMEDLAYFEMRMRQEKEAARRAKVGRVRQSHEELAQAYELRCNALRQQLRSRRDQRLKDALESHQF